MEARGYRKWSTQSVSGSSVAGHTGSEVRDIEFYYTLIPSHYMQIHICEFSAITFFYFMTCAVTFLHLYVHLYINTILSPHMVLVSYP